MKQKLIISLIFSIAGISYSFAQVGKSFEAVNTDGCRLTYKITADNACMLIRNKKAYQKMTNIVVPETIMYKGQVYQVTEIEAGCFRFIDSIEKISLPSSIKELKSTKESEWVKAKSMSGDLDHTDIHYYGMFHNCINLKKVILPDSLMLIGPMAFYGCSSLVEVTLPSGLKDVGGGCFYGCISLHKVTLPSKMTKIKDADYYHAEYSYSTMGYYDKYFHAGFFQDCTTLKDIIIPSSVIEMDSKSFYGCKSLRIVKGFHSKIYIHESYDRWGYQKGQTYKLFENTMINWDSIKATFSYYAEGLIKEDLKNWQKKKDFETIAQYQVRVNKAKRDAKMQELIAKYRKEYIANAEKNQKLSFSIGNYDSEYNVFPLTDTSLGTKYVKVPLADAPLFKREF